MQPDNSTTTQDLLTAEELDMASDACLMAAESAASASGGDQISEELTLLSEKFDRIKDVLVKTGFLPWQSI